MGVFDTQRITGQGAAPNWEAARASFGIGAPGGNTSGGIQAKAQPKQFDWRSLEKFDIGLNNGGGAVAMRGAAPVNESGASANAGTKTASGLFARLEAMGTGELSPKSDAAFQLIV